ncbi:hypothetical protein BKA70DRAFT_1140376 [Coprinopsis sp. MPI-PUGE-AT-0042]|nr:hypothetical protein BKA70DRAFT_1140376 [Coprinopsis sp. MPI-PUGE-AT-0042]
MGPSRLLWFAFGAGFATYWINRKECHRSSDRWGHCRRPAIAQPYASSSETAGSDPEKRAHEFACMLIGKRDHDWDWDEDKFMKQLNELTEVSLDMVLSVTQLMKDKLAEKRAERERREQDRKNQLSPRLI